MHSIDFNAPGGPSFATAAECVDFAALVEAACATPFSPAEWAVIRAAIVYGWCYTARCEHARAAVGADRAEFGMRARLRADGRALLDR